MISLTTLSTLLLASCIAFMIYKSIRERREAFQAELRHQLALQLMNEEDLEKKKKRNRISDGMKQKRVVDTETELVQNPQRKTEKVKKLKKTSIFNSQRTETPDLTTQDSKTDVENDVVDEEPLPKVNLEPLTLPAVHGTPLLDLDKVVETLRKELSATKDHLNQTLSENDTLIRETQSLKEENQSLLETQKELNHTIHRYQNQLTELQRYFRQNTESVNVLRLELEQSNRDKAMLSNQIGQLQDQLTVQNGLFEKRSKEWMHSYHSLQETSSNQILGLSSDLDKIQRDWKKKVDRLETEVKRERFEKETLTMQLKLKKVQCEKSEREAYHAKTHNSRLQEDLKALRTDREKLKYQLADHQIQLRDLENAMTHAEQQLVEKEGMYTQISALKNTISRLEKKNQELAMKLSQALNGFKNEKRDVVNGTSTLEKTVTDGIHDT